MSTKKAKQSNNGNESAIKNDSTQSSESKFSETPQNSFDSSDGGQQYEGIEYTPFATVKQKDGWKIVIGNMIASPLSFESKEEAKEYVEEKHWELLWTMTVWIINNQDKFIFETKKK